MATARGQVLVCSVLVTDIVGFSPLPLEAQHRQKRDLARALEAVLGQVDVTVVSSAAAPRTRAAEAPVDGVHPPLALDTGDGAAICFFGDPEDALFAGLGIATRCREAMQLRTGVHLGPVRRGLDVNGRPNAIGDAINTASRLASFADPDEVLVSRAYREVVARIRDRPVFAFDPRGTRPDKHGLAHELFAAAMLSQTAGSGAGLSETLVERARVALARHVGEVAGVWVRKAAAEAGLAGADPARRFVEGLAGAIGDDRTRAAFLAEMAAARRRAPGDSRAGAGVGWHPEPEERARIETVLTRAIGPIARPLVARAIAQAASRTDMLDYLAGHLPDDGQRAEFLRRAGGA